MPYHRAMCTAPVGPRMQVWSNNEAIEQYRNLLNGKEEVREPDRWARPCKNGFTAASIDSAVTRPVGGVGRVSHGWHGVWSRAVATTRTAPLVRDVAGRHHLLLRPLASPLACMRASA